MGNRAVITVQEANDEVGSIYLHWNGGHESVKAFLDYAKEVGVRQNDPTYALARITQIIGNYFGGTLSIGVGKADHLDCDNGDNGQFIVEGLDIVARKFHTPQEFDQRYYETVLDGVRMKNAGVFDD